jgi:hypothetical protein
MELIRFRAPGLFCIRFMGRYGSRDKRSTITRHVWIGFMSDRKQRPLAPFV